MHFGTNSTEVVMLANALGGPTYSFTVHGPEEFDKPQFIHLGEKVRRAAFVAAISSYGRSQLFRWVDHSHWAKVKVVHCGLERTFHDVTPWPCLPYRAWFASVACVSRRASCCCWRPRVCWPRKPWRSRSYWLAMGEAVGKSKP